MRVWTCAFVEAKDGLASRCEAAAEWDVVHIDPLHGAFRPAYSPSADDPRRRGGAWCLVHACRLALALNRKYSRGLNRLLAAVRAA
jgi:hypothetical protein